MKRVLGLGLSLAAILCLAASASANQITYSYTVPLATTNWSTNLTVPKFNVAGAILNDVKIQLNGAVAGSAKFENQDGAGIVTMDLQALLQLTRPDCSTIVQVIPLAHTIDCVTAYDGVLDFGGTSGKTYSNLSGNASDCAVMTSAPDLALFTGPGNILLPTLAAGASSGSGTGNLILSFMTQASAGVVVTYDYTAVPEPATLTLLGTALCGGIGILRRRRMI